MLLGKRISEKKAYSNAEVNEYIRISGDDNPLHTSDEIAKKHAFRKRIVHGTLLMGWISSVLGTKLPGNGTIYLEQTVKFRKPIYVDEIVELIVEIVEVINAEKGIYRVLTNILLNSGEIAVEGYAVVKYSCVEVEEKCLE